MRSASKIVRPLLAAGAAVSVVTTILLLHGGRAELDAASRVTSRAPALSQQTFAVTVTSGGGSGVYQPGDTVYVEPFRMPDTRVFDRWVGDLPTSAGWDARVTSHMTFTMPTRDVAITGSLDSAPLWALKATTADGGRVFYRHPAPFYHNTGGAIVLLHDTGQSADFWLRSAEARLFQRAAAARGHGIVVLESTDRVARRWDSETTEVGENPDVRRLVDAIGAAGLLGPPLVLLGVGNGGDFAALAAEALLPMSSVHVVGTVLVGSSGAEAGADPMVPTMYVVGEREDPSLRAEAALRHWTLKVAGTPTELVELAPWPVFPRRFWRIDGLTAADSERVHEALVGAGLVSAAGWVTTDPSGLDDPGLPADLAPQWPLVREQLVACWAGHGFSTHSSEAILEFAESGWGLPVPVPTAEPTRRPYAAHINIVNGSRGKSPFYGTDTYGDRDVVHIWADPDPDGMVFDGWTGTTAFVADPSARHTTVTVTSPGCCRLTATYRDSPDWRPAEREVDGRRVFHHVPTEPVGVVFFFHGAGGSASGWVDERRVENWQMLRDAVARGYAVVVTESGDRDARKWSTLSPPDNPDIDHVAWLLAAITASGELPGGLPTFAVGMSNGGFFASIAADALSWQGAAVFQASCRPGISNYSNVPTAWLLADNDRRISNQNAFGCYQRLSERGIDTELHVNAPSPVYPLRFRRIPSVTEAESLVAYEALRAADLLDRPDFQRLSPFESGWREIVASAGTVPVASAGAQLDVCHAEHQFFDDLNAVALNFFDRQRGVVPTPTVTPTPYGTVSATVPPPTATSTPAVPSATPHAVVGVVYVPAAFRAP